jgi:hypothetical protein
MKKFNILRYLESLDVEVDLRSRNRYAYIDCPVCDSSGDPHLWINISDYAKTYSSWGCWKNSFHKGGGVALVMHLENLNYASAKRRVLEFSDMSSVPIEEKDLEPLEFKEIKFPDNGLKKITESKKALEFLKKRGFGYKECIDWDLYYTRSMRYKKLLFRQRIIIPVYYQNMLVAFQGRDITNREKLKYLSSPPDDGYAPLNKTVYNIDRVNPNFTVVTEGVFDAWIAGKDCGVALFGKKIYPEQLEIFYTKEIKYAIIALDGEAFEESESIAHDLSSVGIKVTVLELPDDDDPASLGKKRFWELLNEQKIIT